MRATKTMQAIRTKYHGPTNTKGSRITATSASGLKVTIPMPYDLDEPDAHRKAAQALCAKLHWPGELIGGALSDGYAFVFAPSPKLQYPL